MGFQFKLEKVLGLKEKEKEAYESEFRLSVQKFEEAAHELYSLLKRKEEIENHADSQFHSKMFVNEIQSTQRFLLSMESKIHFLQKKVQAAREQMAFAQEKLLYKTVEVKKYETLKSKQKQEFQFLQSMMETKQNDEFSVLRYAR
ncbi:flagellar export protein FliJ [Fictibacillus aquaticus]|uniref:Flagellar FliJ protein n=1 Tax=Fictibacillus aquaticus TaxID=2021314 RepID=A0A235FC08_9BACL|nr:flagellar export protein FliJ [Fictibacillus aquaticus]OYD58856.1 flagellar export protein FliJ [Fictibacillus aquaticus]